MIQRSSLTSLWPSQRGITNRSARTKPQQALLTIALVSGITIVLCLYLLQTSKINVRNFDILETETELLALQRQNTNALAELAYQQSITQMDKRAEAAGFKPIQSVLYLPISPAQGPDQLVDESLTFATADSSQIVESVSMREQ